MAKPEPGEILAHTGPAHATHLDVHNKNAVTNLENAEDSMDRDRSLAEGTA